MANEDDIQAAREALESFEDPYDPSDTASVEVLLDTMATALVRLWPRQRQRKKSAKTSEEELNDVLARLIEDGLVESNAIAILDEIDNVIRMKDYEGYSDEYVSERLGALLSDLADEIRPPIEQLRETN